MKQEYAFVTRNVKQVILIWQKGSTVLQMALYLQSTGGQQWINIQFISYTYNEIRNLINYKYFWQNKLYAKHPYGTGFQKNSRYWWLKWLRYWVAWWMHSFHFKKYFLPALVALYIHVFLNNFFMHQIRMSQSLWSIWYIDKVKDNL